MSEVYRYKAVQLISESGGRIGYDPHGPDVVMATAYDELLTHQLQRRPVTLPAYEAKLSSSHDWDQGYSDGWKACLEEVTKLGPLYTQADPAEVVCAICRDLGDQCLECEEAEFVAWADKHFASADYRKTHAGVYIQEWMRHAFAAWQARAALGRKP